MVQRVPAAGSGAPGGVKRRALEALTELKWAGKPGADSSVARPSPPTPLFVGEGTGTAGVSVPGSRHPPTEETGVRRSPRGTPAGLAGPGGAGRAGQPLRLSACAPSGPGARWRRTSRAGGRVGGARRACVRWERASRPLARATSLLPSPHVPRPPPPRLPRSPRALLRGGGRSCPSTDYNPFTPVSPRLRELRYKLRCQGLGFSIPASALSLSLPTLEHFLQTAGLRCRCCFPLRARHHPVPRLPLLSLLHFTDGELKVDPWEFCFVFSKMKHGNCHSGRVNLDFPQFKLLPAAVLNSPGTLLSLWSVAAQLTYTSEAGDPKSWQKDV